MPRKVSKIRLRFAYANRETSAWTIITSGSPDASDLYPEIEPEEIPTPIPTRYEIPSSMFHSLYSVVHRSRSGDVKTTEKIIAEVAEKVKMPRKVVEKIFLAICEAMAESLLNMERFSLMGLGTFMGMVTHQKRFMSGPLADVLSIRYCRRVAPVFYPSAEFEKLFIQKYGSRLVRGWELRNRRTGRYSKNSKRILAIREIPEEELSDKQRLQSFAHQYLDGKNDETKHNQQQEGNDNGS